MKRMLTFLSATAGIVGGLVLIGIGLKILIQGVFLK